MCALFGELDFPPYLKLPLPDQESHSGQGTQQQ
jgi:hypothetical protein